MNSENENFNGVITFNNSYHVFKAEKALSKQFSVGTIPGPREISPNCGVALAFYYRQEEQVQQMLIDSALKYEGIFQYDIK